MNRYRHPITGLCLAILLIFALIPKLTLADDGSQEKPFRLYATAASGPIGTIYSISPVAIEGRLAQGEQTIWGGELIQAQPGSSVSVRLDSVGQVTLKNAGMARLTTKLTTLDGNRRHLLVASLISGDMKIDLKQDALAYVESRGSAFTASSGVSFRVEIREGRAVMNAVNGEVQTDPQAAQRAVKIRLVEPNPDPLQLPIDLGLRLDVEARSERQTQWQVTDANDKPVPDVPIILTVGVKAIGGFGKAMAPTFTGTTNAQGIVSAPFNAGPSSAQGTITANVPGTNVSSEVNVNVKSKSHANRNRLLIGAAAVAAVIIIVDPTDPGPIRQAPPPTVIP